MAHTVMSPFFPMYGNVHTFLQAFHLGANQVYLISAMELILTIFDILNFFFSFTILPKAKEY